MAKKSNSELSELKKPKKNNKKSSKKFGPDAVAMKHKSTTHKATNPFETIWSRRKFDILGKKRKGEERRVGLSRSLAIEKRKKTLLKEYEQSGKSSVFLDKRIGEQNEELGEFDKSIMRYQKERQHQLKSSKKSKYNLSDGEDDEFDILGGEQFLGKDDFEDEVPLQEDEDDEQIGSQSKSTIMGLQSPTATEQALQIGTSEEDTGHKSKKEVMKEIMFKSKYYKAEKAKAKDENEQLTEELDNQFTSMVHSKALVALTQPNKLNALKALVKNIGSSEDAKKIDVVASTQGSVVAQKEEPDSYDKLLFSMALDMRARASDRTKTPEEIAEEEKELLERLEAERKKRMVAADESSGEEDNALNDDNVLTKRQRSSGDDLGDSFSLGEERITKVAWLEKVFKKEDANALDESDGSDDEDEDAVVDGEDDEDGTDDDKINSVKSWEQSDDEELDINSEDEDEEVKTIHRSKNSGKNERKKVVSMESVETKTNDVKPNLLQQGELPFTIEAPKSLEEFTSLIENRSHDQIVEAIRRIRKYNPIIIAAEDRKRENRKKLQVFYGVLLQYFAVLSNKKPLDLKLLNSLVKPLLEISAEIPYFAAVCARERMLRIRSQLVEDTKNTGTSSWPSTKILFLLRLWSIIFPCSDFRHAVITPLIVLMCEYLTRCPVMSGRDVLIGCFLCSMVFSVMKQARKFCPEALLFIQTLLLTALDKNQISSDDDNRLYHLLELKAPSRLLRINSPVEEIKCLDFNNLMDSPDDSPFFSSDSFKASIISTVAETLQGFIDLYEKFNSFPEIFNPIKKLLHELTEQKHMPILLVNKLNDIIKAIEKKGAEHQDSRQPLQMRKKKPVPIRLLNPKFEESYVKGRDYDPDRERAELKKLKKDLKREAKGAARELKKDNYFLADLKQKEKALNEEERAEKYRKTSAFLQEQEHAFKSGQLGKGGKKRRK